MSSRSAVSSSVIAVAAAAIGASACCAGPLLLVMLGVGGAWGSRLVALEPLQPYFVTAALVFFASAFFRLYRREDDCTPGEDCALPAVRHRQRVVFWLVSASAALLMAFPLYAPYFY